jgi:hypothetical protein
MHQLAEGRLGASAERVEFVERDFRDPRWPEGLGRFDAVVTLQAIHELRHKRHAVKLHGEVLSVLSQGGTYLVCDHFAGPGGMTNSELYMTLDEQRGALVAAGLLEVEQLLSQGGMVLHRALAP